MGWQPRLSNFLEMRKSTEIVLLPEGGGVYKNQRVEEVTDYDDMRRGRFPVPKRELR